MLDQQWYCLPVFSGGRYIEVFRVDSSAGKGRGDRKDKEIDRNFTRTLKDDEEEEDVAESGRLFVRNLPYTCTEEEINELFAKYGLWEASVHCLSQLFLRVQPRLSLVCFFCFPGPLAEVHFPIDSLTKKPKGFSFVTYMIPENAVTALAQLDGHVFQVLEMVYFFHEQ